MGFKKLIIHPGIGKTATSAVQKFLHNSTGVYDGVRYVYPEHGLDSEFAHHYLSNRYPHFNEKKYEEYIKAILSDAAKELDDCVYIISSEFLAHCEQVFIDDLIFKFREIFEEITVIYAIRNYVDLLHSSYLQAVKVNYGVVNGESIESYSARMGEGFSFPFLFSKWSSADSILFINYDKYKRDFLQKFVSVCGISERVKDKENENVNSSIIEDVVNLIFSYDKNNHTPVERKKFIDNMKSFSHNYKNYKSTVMKDILICRYQEEWEKDLSFLINNFEEV